MEPMHLMLNKATEQGMLTPICNRHAKIRISLFADAAAIFLNPVGGEVQVAKNILAAFGRASGLVTNTEKSAVYPIRCEGLDLQHIMEAFQCPVGSFPCKYLGLPLHARAIRRVDIQPLIDKMGGKLAAWKGRLLNKAGRLRLVNSVLSSLPTYFLKVFKLPKWAAKKMDKLRRSFLWKGVAEVNGGHCLVKWGKTMRPKKFGGLGILDLDLFSRALRLRWLWYQWTTPERHWVGTEPPVDAIDRQLFQVRWSRLAMVRRLVSGNQLG
jgi:mannosylglycoprotein endo-beta-mannosidase